jgi:hypothetical protein
VGDINLQENPSRNVGNVVKLGITKWIVDLKVWRERRYLMMSFHIREYLMRGRRGCVLGIFKNTCRS